jgi:hypothetical protein
MSPSFYRLFVLCKASFLGQDPSMREKLLLGPSIFLLVYGSSAVVGCADGDAVVAPPGTTQNTSGTQAGSGTGTGGDGGASVTSSGTNTGGGSGTGGEGGGRSGRERRR